MTPRFVRAALPAAVVLASVTAMLTAPASAASKSDDVWVRFESAKPGHSIVRLANAGKAPVTVKIVRSNGGRLVSRQARNTRSRVADFPAYAGGSSAPHAVIAVVNHKRDRLAPRNSPFSFGVDFKIDAAAVAARDDGNNLMQRGYFGSPAQYKLQVDKGVIGCRIKGELGSVFLTGDTPVDAAKWYRVRCSLTPVADGPDNARLRISTLGPKGRAHLLEDHAANVEIGRLTFPKARPLAIGGKIKDSLLMPARVEQYNGLLDNVFFRLG
jgi:hypothetical protein